MKKILLILAILLLIVGTSFARDTTTDLEILLPTWDEEDPEFDILEDLIINWNIVEDFANDPLEFDSDLERLEDRVGAMFTGNTETGVTVTYQDADNTVDVVVDTDLAVIAGLAYTDGNFIVGNGSAWVAESGATARASLGLTIGTNVQAYDAGLTSIAALTTAAGTILYTSTLDTYIVVSANATATHMFLRQYSSGAPAWIQLDSDDLSDVASIAMLDETEAVTGSWTFIGNPTIRTVSDTATAPPLISFQKRDVTGDDVDQGDYLMKLNAYGYHGSAYHLGATIRVIVDAAPGDTADMPARICFLTSPDGTATPVLRMGIFSDGDIYMGDGAWTNFFKVNSVGTVWQTSTSTAVTGDVTNLRTILTCNAASGGDAVTGQNARAIYAQVVVGASKQAGLLQAGLFTVGVGTGVIAYNVHVLCAHYSSGASTTIGGDLYIGYLRSQTRSTTSRAVTGYDYLLALENEAIEGTGMTMDGAIRIFDTNVGGDGFTYGIDMSGASIATDIILSDSHTIIDSATGIAISLLSPTTISGLDNVTSEDADYILIWDATDSVLKRCDMGEVRGGGNGATAWDDITDPDANDEIDFAAYVTELNVVDFRIGDGGANYVKFADAGAVTFEGTASIKTVPFTGVHAIGNSGSTETVDWENGNYQSITISEACVISFSNPFIGTLTLHVTWSATAALTFDGGYTILEEGGTELVLSDTDTLIDIIKIYYYGTADTYVMGALLDVKD